MNGAQALGKAGQVGELTENALADMIIVPYSGGLGKAYEGVLQHQGAVAGSMIDGTWAIEPARR